MMTEFDRVVVMGQGSVVEGCAWVGVGGVGLGCDLDLRHSVHMS